MIKSEDRIFLESKIKVVLMGWEQPEQLDPQLIQTQLQHFLPLKEYHNKYTKEKISHVATKINYTVEHVSELPNLGDYLKRAPRKIKENSERLTIMIDQPLLSFFEQKAGDARTVFVLKPSKKKLLQSENFEYAYSFLNSSTEVRSFVGSRRFVVVDLTAGPVFYGSIWNDATFEVDHRSKTGVLDGAAIVDLVAKASQFVFFPDLSIQFNSRQAISKTSQIYVPILVFRNHAEFDPLNPSSDVYHIDLTQVKQNVESLQSFLNVKVHVAISLHQFSEHRALSSALFKARILADETNELVEVDYVDAKMLKQEIGNAHEDLVAGLFHKPSDGSFLIPVIVFSLLDTPRPLLFSHHSQSTVVDNAVFVMQNHHNSTILPYFSQESTLRIDSRRISRSIMAGITEALGMANPMTRFSSAHQELLTDFLWAVGHHPFGPFSNFSNVGTLFSDHFCKGQIITLLDAIMDRLQSVDERVKTIFDQFVYDPFSDSDFSHGSQKNFSLKPLRATLDKIQNFREKFQRLVSSLEYDSSKDALQKVSQKNVESEILHSEAHHLLSELEKYWMCSLLLPSSESSNSFDFFSFLGLSCLLIFGVYTFIKFVS